MKTYRIAVLLLGVVAGGLQAAEPLEYKGFRACTKCHEQIGESWIKTAHASAFESLKPQVKAEAKKKAGLDPARDFTRDPDCIGCHVTGYGAPGGYHPDMGADQAKVVLGVTCESCHGAGSIYRQLHGKAEDKLKKAGESTDRQTLVDAKQNFDYERACAACHLNYPSSGWSGVKPPHSPFTPSINTKYRFDFGKAVLNTGGQNPIHMHFKLRGVFKGEHAPVFREELQRSAQEPDD